MVSSPPRLTCPGMRILSKATSLADFSASLARVFIAMPARVSVVREQVRPALKDSASGYGREYCHAIAFFEEIPEPSVNAIEKDNYRFLERNLELSQKSLDGCALAYLQGTRIPFAPGRQTGRQRRIETDVYLHCRLPR